MLFAWDWVHQAWKEAIPQQVNVETNDFLSQPYVPIQSVGPLCDENGRRAAMMMLFEADNRDAAQAFVDNSPYKHAGIFQQYHLYGYHDQIG